MTIFAEFFALLLLAMTQLGIASAENSEAEQTDLVCDIGPITRTFGHSHWLVYGCNDMRTVVVMSAPDNAAKPFYFVLYPSEAGYQLSGEGKGDRGSTVAAFDELKALSPTDIANLIQETRQR